jgi:DNA-binding CsgD family transcriptional regulator
MSQTGDRALPDPAERPASPAPKRDRSAARSARLAKETARERRIVDLLNRGLSMDEIARRDGVTLNRMRKVVGDILARRAPQAPAEYLALQVGRLNEAMLLSYGHMYSEATGPNFKAIESVLKIVREMDRYHGFLPAAGGRAIERAPALPTPPLALSPPDLGRVAIGAATD